MTATKQLCEQTGLDRYPTRLDAEAFINDRKLTGHPYQCVGCKGWHIGRIELFGRTTRK
jgi:hypothetical protein